MRNKLMQAAAVAVETERGRVLWLIEEIQKELEQGIDEKIMTVGQLHVAKTKLRLFLALTQKLRRAIISNVQPTSAVETLEEADDDGAETESVVDR